MIAHSEQMDFMFARELIIDNFAGGGGASHGIEQAFGRHVDIAINHDPEAIAMHMANHPHTEHHCESVWDIDPITATNGRPVGLAWFSPDCKHFSKAKGGKPVEKKIRGLAWIVVKWAKLVKPRVIMLENVEEFQDWGPLKDDDKPCPVRKGHTFRRWKQQLIDLGYQVEHRQLRACDYGSPTIRKRLFLIARCDGRPIVWPKPTHGKGKRLEPFKTAADCMDWKLPTPSIFLTKEEGRAIKVRRPLAEATMARIAKGVKRYVLGSAKPFIVPIANYNGSVIAHDIDEPLRTITASPKGGSFALVSAFLAKHYTGVIGHEIDKPIGTVTTVDHHSLVASHMIKLRGSCKDGQPIDKPAPTITAGGTHLGEVRAFLIKYYGTDQDPHLNKPMHTVTTKDRFGLVTVHGEEYQIVDIGMRMLAPRELYRAQGFPDNYIIDVELNGRKLSKAAQVRMCGNSVSPNVAIALVKANVGVTTVAKQKGAA